jgi:hypothetical protein
MVMGGGAKDGGLSHGEKNGPWHGQLTSYNYGPDTDPQLALSPAPSSPIPRSRHVCKRVEPIERASMAVIKWGPDRLICINLRASADSFIRRLRRCPQMTTTAKYLPDPLPLRILAGPVHPRPDILLTIWAAP